MRLAEFINETTLPTFARAKVIVKALFKYIIEKNKSGFV